MARFLSCGIDHGTTNSAIAVVDEGRPHVIKPDGFDSVLPSAVYIQRRGRQLVGRPALNAMRASDASEGNGYTGYKRTLGQNESYHFAAARTTLTDVELAAIVLRDLRRAYREEMQRDLGAAVITIPAVFDQAAWAATETAAQAAGLEFVRALAEPVAAAVAYGMRNDQPRANWLIFDIGGGTLDVSLVIVRDGTPVIPENGHDGDTQLGGNDFDRELLGYVLEQLRGGYRLDDFRELSERYGMAWARLRQAVEETKIELSHPRNEERVVHIDGVLCEDDEGKPVEVEVPVTRALFERLIAADVERAVSVCQRLLGSNRLAPGDIDKLILVGGPSKTPYLQRVLKERLGIPFEMSIDPMTAVAQGAALYATTVRDESSPVVASAESAPAVEVTIEHPPASREPVCSVVLRVAAAGGGCPECTVEITRGNGMWSSGALRPDEDGVVLCDVHLEERPVAALSSFVTRVSDGAGNVLAEVDGPSIWHPEPGGVSSRPSSLRIGIENNRSVVVIDKGKKLPARGRVTVETTKGLLKGRRDDVIRIPLLEGVTHHLGSEDVHADAHMHVGSFLIKGDDERVSHSLTEGTRIDLNVRQHDDRKITVRAYVHGLDEELEAEFECEPREVDLEEMNRRFAALKGQLAEVRELQASSPVPDVAQGLAELESIAALERLEKDFQRASEDERGATMRAYKNLLKLAGAANVLRRHQQVPSLTSTLTRLEPLCKEEYADTHKALSGELEAAVGPPPDHDVLDEVAQHVDALEFQVYRPYWDVLLDTYALGGMTVSTYQNSLFKRAVALIEEVEQQGGVKALTPGMLEKLKGMHRELQAAYEDLMVRREQTLAEVGGNVTSLRAADIRLSR